MHFDLSSWAMKDFQARNPRFAPRPNGARRRFLAFSAALLIAAATAAGVYFAPAITTMRGELQAAQRSVSAGEVARP